MPSNKE